MTTRLHGIIYIKQTVTNSSPENPIHIQNVHLIADHVNDLLHIRQWRNSRDFR